MEHVNTIYKNFFIYMLLNKITVLFSCFWLMFLLPAIIFIAFRENAVIVDNLNYTDREVAIFNYQYEIKILQFKNKILKLYS